MGSILIVEFLISFVSILVLLWIGIKFIPENITKKLSPYFIGLLLLISFFLIIISFYMPEQLTEFLINSPLGRSVKEDSYKDMIAAKAQVGDYYGGLMNPIIAIAGIIVTGLAFYIQYQANQDIRNQFKIQQFESQFTEMLRLHKENVNEMEYSKDITKRKVFSQLREDLHDLFENAIKYNPEIGLENMFLECYNCFYFGYNEKVNYQFLNTKPILLSSPFNYYPNLNFKKLNLPVINLVKKFSSPGFSRNISHYYRHLFLIVKYIVDDKTIIDHNEKMKYLKILRAQLSNHEQMMLFYNWLATDYGSDWEQNVKLLKSENGKNYFFTRYRMIHNLWHDELFNDEFIHSKIKELILKYEVVKMDDNQLFENQPKFL